VCYADRNSGVLVKFIDAFNDFGLGINAVWQSKLMDFNYPEWYKNVVDMWFTTRANSNSNLKINYYDDNNNILTSQTIPSTTTKSFSWLNFKWSTFTWKSQKFAPTLHFKPGIKNVRYFQLEVSNSGFNENLSIISIVIKYVLTRIVR
ncbi:MAG: hypothetical protein Q8936_24775, partial [Bacillota bacterium]|nr:hypothetical protein [Bacillota bacterium]